jgi:hypothetical protein
MTPTDEQPIDLFSGTPVEQREQRLSEGAENLTRPDRASWLRRPQFLLWVSGTLMLVGLALILLGWVGASRSILLEEQIPYLVSGGVFGLALAMIGAVTLFAQWLTVLIRENREREVARRRDHDELVRTVQSLTDVIAGQQPKSRTRRS